MRNVLGPAISALLVTAGAAPTPVSPSPQVAAPLPDYGVTLAGISTDYPHKVTYTLPVMDPKNGTPPHFVRVVAIQTDAVDTTGKPVPVVTPTTADEWLNYPNAKVFSLDVSNCFGGGPAVVTLTDLPSGLYAAQSVVSYDA